MDMQVYSNLPVSNTKRKETQTETDTQLTQLRKVIHDRWPEETRKCPSEHLRVFWNHRDELSQINGIIFKGEIITIPRLF
jgi:hypothetical protein